jgi:hypothetical protein
MVAQLSYSSSLWYLLILLQSNATPGPTIRMALAMQTPRHSWATLARKSMKLDFYEHFEISYSLISDFQLYWNVFLGNGRSLALCSWLHIQMIQPCKLQIYFPMDLIIYNKRSTVIYFCNDVFSHFIYYN